jgi:micrococcal nuclease
MKYFFLSLLILFSFNALAQQQIKLEDVKDHVGDSVTLRATIYGGKYFESIKGSPTFLNVGGEYPNAPLTLVIWGDARKQFRVAPEVLYQTRQEFISGKIVLYKGKPEIIITSPGQLEDVVAPPTPKQ